MIATTRNPAKKDMLADYAGHVVIDNGAIAEPVRAITPGGVHAAVELVGTNTLRDTLLATRSHGVVCFSGMLSDRWTIPDFYPMDFLPNGVRLTAYSGEARDLPPEVLQEFLDDVADGHARAFRSPACTGSTRSSSRTATWSPVRSSARASS